MAPSALVEMVGLVVVRLVGVETPVMVEMAGLGKPVSAFAPNTVSIPWHDTTVAVCAISGCGGGSRGDGGGQSVGQYDKRSGISTSKARSSEQGGGFILGHCKTSPAQHESF
jgi:hypothetical protein